MRPAEDARTGFVGSIPCAQAQTPESVALWSQSSEDPHRNEFVNPELPSLGLAQAVPPSLITPNVINSR